MENLTKHCNDFTSTARQLAVKLDAQMVNDLGFSKRYVRCLQVLHLTDMGPKDHSITYQLTLVPNIVILK